MKTIGLIGGMSWESTVTYYQVLNNVIKEKLGGLHSAKCLLYSLDFHEIEKCQSTGEWEVSAQILSEAALTLEKAGADFIVICITLCIKWLTKFRKLSAFLYYILQK